MRFWLILLVLGALTVSAYAQLYADVTFTVLETGEVQIAGDTNYQTFQGTTNKLTSKEGDLWFLNITSPVFEEYVYTIQLPKNSIINYIKSNSQARIEEKAGAIIITGTGSKKPVDIKIQYAISKEKRISSWLVISGVVLIILLVAALFILTIKKKAQAPQKKELKRELYTERQLIILDYLQEHGTVTQAQLEKDLKLPKSSLSRNIATLVQKGVIFRETKGMSNTIGFKD